jgi:hypothetical protein
MFDIEDFIEGIPWWVKYLLFVGGALMSAFASKLPESIQVLGLNLGIALSGLGCVGIVWHFANEWRDRHHKPRFKLEPFHLIALGLVVALAGVGWQIYRNYQTPVVVAASAAPTSAEPQSPSAKPQRKYSSADVPKLTPIVQKISELVTSQGTPLAFEIYNFCVTLRQKLGDLGTKETIRQLQDFAERANKFGDEIDAVQSNAGYYQDEVNYIIDAKAGNVAQSVAQEMKNVSRWLDGIASPINQGGSEILQNMTFQLLSKAKDFDKWRTETPKRIQEIRKELDAAG